MKKILFIDGSLGEGSLNQQLARETGQSYLAVCLQIKAKF